MQWNELSDLGQLDQIRQESSEKAILIFKHSTRCYTSRTVLDRLQRHWNAADMQTVKPYFLDLIRYQEISEQIANVYNVRHESPQVLVIRDDKSFYNESHFGIDYTSLSSLIKNQNSQFAEQIHEG